MWILRYLNKDGQACYVGCKSELVDVDVFVKEALKLFDVEEGSRFDIYYKEVNENGKNEN